MSSYLVWLLVLRVWGQSYCSQVPAASVVNSLVVSVRVSAFTACEVKQGVAAGGRKGWECPYAFSVQSDTRLQVLVLLLESSSFSEPRRLPTYCLFDPVSCFLFSVSCYRTWWSSKVWVSITRRLALMALLPEYALSIGGCECFQSPSWPSAIWGEKVNVFIRALIGTKMLTTNYVRMRRII